MKVRGDGVLFYFSISSIFDIIIIFWCFNSTVVTKRVSVSAVIKMLVATAVKVVDMVAAAATVTAARNERYSG